MAYKHFELKDFEGLSPPPWISKIYDFQVLFALPPEKIQKYAPVDTQIAFPDNWHNHVNKSVYRCLTSSRKQFSHFSDFH